MYNGRNSKGLEPVREILMKTDYDRLLHIETDKRQMGFHRSFHYHRYEPTPYEALDEFCEQYPFSKSDRVVDFGCGKGRLNFYLHHRFKCTTIGVEMNRDFYRDAMVNLDHYLRHAGIRKNNVHFKECLAEDYAIHPRDNRFYFFNPFSVQIFMSVINNILHSVEGHLRDVDIILYYSPDDYIHYMEDHPLFRLKAEVDLTGRFAENPYEKFRVYELFYGGEG
ncbi:SAM-dependent methyltransferase [Rossellomorea marisflavi]|nr:SAM-dependent methyltransferase [Rossellomorea marisflavi]